MFLRIKKKKNSGKDSYSFMLVENNRINGKVKQKVVKYLTSYTEMQKASSILVSAIPDINEFNNAKLRIYFWVAIAINLKGIDLDGKKEEIIDKISKHVPVPIQEDFEIYAKKMREFSKDQKTFIDWFNERMKLINELIS